MLLALASVGPAWVGASSGAAVRLAWDPSTGAVLETPAVKVWLDRNEEMPAAEVRFLPDGSRQVLDRPTTTELSPACLKLTYRLTAPAGSVIDVLRTVTLVESGNDVAVVETFALRPSQPVTVDVEIFRPFALFPKQAGAQPGATCPLRSGWAKKVALCGQPLAAEYRLGHALTGDDASHLALPVVHVSGLPGGSAAVMADPAFSSLWEISWKDDAVQGRSRYRYAGSRVPLAHEETRRFGLWLSPRAEATAGFPAALDAFFAQMLPEVPPGPKWLHDIAMVGYDYLSDGGEGWDRDVRLLAEWLSPAERRRVALCLHGWYDAIGSYSYDPQARRIKDAWVAFGPTRKIPLTPAELKRRLRLARESGFRVLLYFGDGLASDSGVPGFRDAWVYRDAHGNATRGWQGPDTFGTTYWLNPAHPEVRAWFLDYLRALLEAFGPEVDGLVWDETFQSKIGQIAAEPEPAYCDRAMLALVKDLTERVHALDPQKVFLASDCSGVIPDVPGYAMVADGTYQDTACQPAAWSWGLFANWRNVLWSCNWADVTGLNKTRYGVETYGTPVAISNGWGDDRGPSEWTPQQREQILALFHRRLQRAERVRYLAADPLQAQRGDPLPAAEAGLVNWALASRGSRAQASSEDAPRYPAAGAINGVRDTTDWGNGHGWASNAGPRPHWLQVTFTRPQPIRRFVVITYHHDDAASTAQVWGVKDYELQVRDGRTDAWRTVVTESQGRAVGVRVHDLPQAVEVKEFRIVVRQVAPADGRARLLQLEAWGADGS
ncbi:MAG: discoidin domain-containing protein [Pirellulales bacterium]|nr:discoidin domain-containing protein [Pirellulales bacterium]